MSTQSRQSHKRQEQNNTEWLDELINKIENIVVIIKVTLVNLKIRSVRNFCFH